MTITAGEPGMKARRPKFDENEHPRDRKGRFIEIGARVSVWGAGGATGTVERNLGGGRIAVRRESDGKVVSIHRNYLTVTARPDGGKPTDKPEDKPAAAPPETPNVTPPAEAPSKGDTTGPAPLDAPASPDLPKPAEATAPLTDEQYAERVDALTAAIGQAIAGGQRTDAAHSDGKGGYTAERRAQHAEIVEALYAEAANVPRDRRAIVAGGLGGSGKGTVLAGPAGVNEADYLTIDVDAIKGVMIERGMAPEIEGVTPLETAPLIHAESSYIADALRERALADGTNVLLDMTMGARGATERRLDGLTGAGYDDIEAVFVTVPLEVSVERALDRHRRGLDEARAGRGQGGRYVPPEIIRAQADEEYGSLNRRNFYELRERFSRVREFDNSGKKPRLAPIPGGSPQPTPKSKPKSKPAVLKGEALRTDLRARADAFPDTLNVAPLRALAERKGLAAIPGTTLVVARSDGRGGGFTVYHAPSGLGLSQPAMNLKTAKDATDLGARFAALRDADGNSPFPDEQGMAGVVRDWRSADGLSLRDAMTATRAEFDTERGDTDSSAIRQRRERAEFEQRQREQAVADAPLLAEGYADTRGTEVSLGADVVVQVPSQAYVQGVSRASDAVEARGRLIDVSGGTADAPVRARLLQVDGTQVQVQVTAGRFGREPRVFARPNTEPMPGWEDMGDGVYVKPLFASGSSTSDGSGVVIADGRERGYIGPSRSGEGFDYNRTRAEDGSFLSGDEAERSSAFPTRREAARALAGRPDARSATLGVEADERRGYADALAATAGDGDEVLSADALLQRARGGGLNGRRVRVAGATSGEQIEGVVRFVTPGGRTDGDAPSPDGTVARVALTTRADGDTGLAEVPLTVDDRVVLLADVSAPVDLLATPDNLAAMSDADLSARSEALRLEIVARRTSNTGPRRRERDAFVAARTPIDAEIARRSNERQRAEDEENGIVNRDRMTNPEAVTSLVASLPEADRQGLEDLSERVADYVDVISATSLPERPRPGEDGLDPLARRQIQAERDRATDVADGLWANLDDDLGILFERVEANGDGDDLADIDRVISSLIEQGEEAGYDTSRGDRRRRRTAMRTADLDALRGQYQGVRGYGRDATDLREDYAEEFERRGLMSDGSPEPIVDEDGKDAVNEAADEVRDAAGTGRNPTADLVAGTAEAYASEIGEDAGAPNAAAVAADLDDAIDSALRDAPNEGLRDALEALRGTIRPEHRVSGETVGQTSITDDLTDEPLLPARRQGSLDAPPGGTRAVTEPESIARGTIYPDGTPVAIYGFAGATYGTSAGAHTGMNTNVVVRYSDGSYDRFSPNIVVSQDAFDAGWHIVGPDGRIVAGGPKISQERAVEIAAERGEGFTAVTGREHRTGRATPTTPADVNRVPVTEVGNGDTIMVEIDGQTVKRSVRGVGPGRGNSRNLVLLDEERYRAWLQAEEADRRANPGPRPLRTARDVGFETTVNLRNSVTVEVLILASDPSSPEVEASRPPAYSLTDSRWGALQIGDRFVDSSGEGEVVARNEDGSLDVRRSDGVVVEESGDDSEVVQIARALSASEMASMLPPPRPHERGTAVSRPSLPTSRRRIINGYALDTDPAQPLRVREAAARLRNRQPLSAEESAALRDALRGIATNPDTPARRAQALQRAAGSLDIASASAAVNLGGAGRRKRPANAGLVRRLVPGSRVRIPATQGYDDTEGTVLSVKQEGRTAVRTLTIRTDDGRVVTRSLLGGTYIETREGSGEPIQDRLPVGDLKPGDRVNLGDGKAATITGVRVVTDDPDVVLVSFADTEGAQQTDLPFGRNVQVARLYGPDAAPPEPEDEEPRVGTASEIGVGDIIAGTYQDTGNGYTMRVTEITPMLGGTKYRVFGEMNSGSESGGTYDADQEVTFLPSLPEDAPLPNPKAIEPEQVGRRDIQPGDRIVITNPVTGRDVRGVVDYVETVDGEDDDGTNLPDGVTNVGLYGGFGGTTVYSLSGDERAGRVGNLGADYVEKARLQAKTDSIARTLAQGAASVEKQALSLFAGRVRSHRVNIAPRRADGSGGTTYLPMAFALTKARGERDTLSNNAVRGMMNSSLAADTAREMIGADADDPQLLQATRLQLDTFYRKIAADAIDRAVRGLDTAGITGLDSEMDGGRIDRLLSAVGAAGDRYGGPTAEDEALGDITRDYTGEMEVLASTAPAVQAERALSVTERAAIPKADARPLGERMADYRKALPEVFGSAEVVRTEYVGDIDLEALKRGEKPKTREVRRAVRERASDGGPTAETLAQLEVVKAAGAEVATEVNSRVRRLMFGEQADALDAAEKRLDEIGTRIAESSRLRRDALLSERTNGAETDHTALTARLRALRDKGGRLEGADRDLQGLARGVTYDVSQEPEQDAMQGEYTSAVIAARALRLTVPGAREEAEAEAAAQALLKQKWDYETGFLDRYVAANSGGGFASLMDAERAQDAGTDTGFAAVVVADARAALLGDATFKGLRTQSQAADDAWRDRRRANADTNQRLATARSRATAQVIAEFREIGPRPGKAMRYTGLTERAEAVKALRWAEQFYPSDWLDKASGTRLTVFSKGGHYNRTDRIIRLDKDAREEVEGAGPVGRIAIHELGHHMEYEIPGIMAAESAYLWSRTSTGEIGSRTRTPKTSLRYARKGGRERAYKDEFNEHYSGKDEYNGQGAHELFTTGMEDAFAGSYTGTIYGPPSESNRRLDEDYQAFIFGVLSLL